MRRCGEFLDFSICRFVDLRLYCGDLVIAVIGLGIFETTEYTESIQVLEAIGEMSRYDAKSHYYHTMLGGMLRGCIIVTSQFPQPFPYRLNSVFSVV